MLIDFCKLATVFSAPIAADISSFDQVVETTLPEVILWLHQQGAFLPDMPTNHSRSVILDIDDSTDKGKVTSPFSMFH